MEQWVSDGRTIIQDRGSSLIPQDAEAQGFVDISGGMRGLMKRQVQPGTGQSPHTYAECLCSYSYWTIRGELADCVPPEDALEVVVGAGQVTQGFDEAFSAMQAGEIAQFWLDPAFAFRENGMRCSRQEWDVVGPDEPVRLELHLLRFLNPMNSSEKLANAHILKDEGNSLFQSKEYEKAIASYHNALRRLGTAMLRPDQGMTSEEAHALTSTDRALRSTIHSNIAACWYSLEDFEKCLSFCERSLKLNSSNAKSLFRKALVMEKRCEFDACMELLDAMLKGGLGVADEIAATRRRVEACNAIQTMEQKSVYRKMFTGDS